MRDQSKLLRRIGLAGLFCGSLALSACLGPWAKRSADRQVYKIIKAKQTQALEHPRDFTLEPAPNPVTDSVLATAGTTGDSFTTEGLRLTLADALALAVSNNRTYQGQKETLYLSALTLTEQRREFSPIFAGLVTGKLDQAPVLDSFNHVADISRQGEVDSTLGMTQLLAATGARIAVGFSNSFFKAYAGDPNPASTGALTAGIVQPLLRGAGMRAASETLTQAERDVIYQVRTFSRFEKKFLVDRVEEYFRLLQSLDTIRNQRASYVNLSKGRERNELLYQAGRLTAFSVDQAQQQEINARNAWLSAKTQFVQQLDNMKLNLGLPTELKVFPQEAELAMLSAAGLAPLDLTDEESVRMALDRRVDLRTTLDQVEDASRKIKVFENSLLPQVDLSGSLSVPDDGKSQPMSLDWKRRDATVRGTVGLPLDRIRERNEYREGLITLERARRAAQQTRDQIVQEVRVAHQNVRQARESFEIQNLGVKIAERRVDSTNMFLQASRATVRDVLDADDSLLNARNARTRALIDYTAARLRFLVATEALEVEDGGRWTESAGGVAQAPAGGKGDHAGR